MSVIVFSWFSIVRRGTHASPLLPKRNLTPKTHHATARSLSAAEKLERENRIEGALCSLTPPCNRCGVGCDHSDEVFAIRTHFGWRSFRGPFALRGQQFAVPQGYVTGQIPLQAQLCFAAPPTTLPGAPISLRVSLLSCSFLVFLALGRFPFFLLSVICSLLILGGSGRHARFPSTSWKRNLTLKTHHVTARNVRGRKVKAGSAKRVMCKAAREIRRGQARARVARSEAGDWRACGCNSPLVRPELSRADWPPRTRVIPP